MQTQTVPTNIDERRIDTRYLSEDKFSVKILFSSDDPKSLGKTFPCSLVDVSKNGVQITAAEPLTVKSVLDLSITLVDSHREYFVTGNIKWCKASAGISYTVGIALKNRSGTATDLENWKTLIKNIK